MLKKAAALFVVFSLLFSITAPFIDDVDARPRYRSPSRSYQPGIRNPAPQRTDGINDGAATRRPSTTTPATGTRTGAGRGFGGGMFGGLLGGLMLGGLAGMLFGGILPGLGLFGSFLGLAINLLAIYVLFVIIRKAVQAFTNRNRPGNRYR